MKRPIALAFTLMLLGTLCCAAQKKEKDQKLFEESSARMIQPQVKVFITPQVCDMQMLSTDREEYGPYQFEIKSLDQTTNAMLDNCKARALYRATMETGADALIEPLYNCYVLSSNDKIMCIELSGYPVKYVNFRKLGKDDLKEIDMISVVYPAANTSVQTDLNNNPAAANPATPAPSK